MSVCKGRICNIQISHLPVLVLTKIRKHSKHTHMRLMTCSAKLIHLGLEKILALEKIEKSEITEWEIYLAYTKDKAY